MITHLANGVERNVGNVRNFTLEHPGAQRLGRHQWQGPVEHPVKEWGLNSSQTSFQFHTSPLSCWSTPFPHKPPDLEILGPLTTDVCAQAAVFSLTSSLPCVVQLLSLAKEPEEIKGGEVGKIRTGLSMNLRTW